MIVPTQEVETMMSSFFSSSQAHLFMHSSYEMPSSRYLDNPQIVPSISCLDLSYRSTINLGGYLNLFRTLELIVIRRNRQDILMFSFTSTNLVAID